MIDSLDTRPVVAVVEDSRTILRFACVVLSERYQTVEYDTGPDALAGIIASAPDVVLLDISLPGMDGTEVLGRLRQNPDRADLPVIAFTASSDQRDRDTYLAMGFDAYITKPIVDAEVLFDEIARLLGR